MEEARQSSAHERNHQVVLMIEADLAVLRLGEEDERVVVLTESRMDSLFGAIEEIANNPQIKGLVITGATPALFCAGADINVIKSVTDPAIGKKLAERGQEIFAKIEALKCTTVAAISGACVGGGCELVLACDYRVLADTARIGLPEIKLGILPGFGGTQRLPRLIGLPKALDIILQGRVVNAKRAKQLGMADLVVKTQGDEDEDFANLEEAAVKIALDKSRPSRNTPGLMEMLMTKTGPGRSIVHSKTVQAVQKNTKGHYPAPPRAVEVIFHGLKHGTASGYEEEAKALGDLVATPESKALVHIYFLTEEANKLGKSAKALVEKPKVALFGAGTMGAGIAAAFVSSGAQVVVIEPGAETRERAHGHIEKVLSKRRSFSEEKRKKLLGNLTITDDVSAIAKSNFVLEAIFEDLGVKQELFLKALDHVGNDTILATNTSSLSVDDIVEGISSPDRMVGMHFFNPAEKMPLVEVVRGKKTGEKALVYTAALTTFLGKYPVIVEDGAGFLVNRLLSPYLMESAHLLADGYSIKAIDKAAVKFGMPMGPLRLLDEIGLDVASKVAEMMVEAYGDRMKGPEFSSTLVDQKRLGKKSGKGFYIHEGKDANPDAEIPTLLGLPAEPKQELTSEALAERLVLPMLNEAVRCLDEGVAGEPGAQAAGQVDLATVMGTGFAPFRGGILHFAENLGAKALYDKLQALADTHGSRFVPCEGISRRASGNQSFYSKAS